MDKACIKAERHSLIDILQIYTALSPLSTRFDDFDHIGAPQEPWALDVGGKREWSQ